MEYKLVVNRELGVYQIGHTVNKEVSRWREDRDGRPYWGTDREDVFIVVYQGKHELAARNQLTHLNRLAALEERARELRDIKAGRRKSPPPPSPPKENPDKKWAKFFDEDFKP